VANSNGTCPFPFTNPSSYLDHPSSLSFSPLTISASIALWFLTVPSLEINFFRAYIGVALFMASMPPSPTPSFSLHSKWPSYTYIKCLTSPFWLTSPWRMEVINTSKMLVSTYKTILHHNPKDHNWQALITCLPRICLKGQRIPQKMLCLDRQPQDRESNLGPVKHEGGVLPTQP
jgi:hypothetical protein